MPKKILLLLPALITGIYFAASHYKQNPPATVTPNQLPPQVQTVKLIIDPGNSSPLSFVHPASASFTAYSLLFSTAKSKNWEISVKQYDFGVFVESLLGKTSDSDNAWIYFLNGQSGSVAADRQPVQSGDVVEWKYVKPQF